MKRIWLKILTVVMFVVMLGGIGFTSQAENMKQEKSRAIYVVFDNSGSMYGPGNAAWSQATYAMEVFAAMMNFDSGDIMRVFPMHEVTVGGNSGTDRTTSISIQSISDIAQIHNMYTPNPMGTPYTQANTAANELAALLDTGAVQEGWLVVLTDGDFDSDLPAAGLQEDLKQKAQLRENMFVQYLAMGNAIKNVPEGSEQLGLYTQQAGDSAAVLNELAVVSNRIFKRNEYPGYKDGESMNFDIPLGKLIVFAQGKEVHVKSLKNKEGGEIPVESYYEVSCSSTDGAGRTSYVTETPTKDTSLKGVVAVFSDPSSIVEGSYTLDVEGADSTQVYYEPNVKFGMKLICGDKTVDSKTIAGGHYKIKAGFVNQLSGKFIKESKLLGKPEYKVTVNGEEHGLGGGKGSTQFLEVDVEGDTLDLKAEVKYLNDYTDYIEQSYQVCTLGMKMETPSLIAIKDMEKNPEGVQVKVTRNGQPLTKEQWKQAALDVVAKDKEGNDFLIDWDIQKGKEVSSWVLKPKYKDGDMFDTGTGKMKLTVSVSIQIDGDAYGKSQTATMEIKDDKKIIDYLKRYWKQIAISLLFLIVLLGYIPPFKKRFSRKMKRRPTIECTAEKIGIRDTMVKGTFEKNRLSVILPYKAEVGRLAFSASPVKKVARLKAAGGGGMWILNTSAFAGKEDVTFNGMTIPENYKGNYRISASTIIVVTTPEFTYTCIPNVQRTADGSIKRTKKRK